MSASQPYKLYRARHQLMNLFQLYAFSERVLNLVANLSFDFLSSDLITQLKHGSPKLSVIS